MRKALGSFFMKKIFVSIAISLFFFSLFLFFPKAIIAQKIAENSAGLNFKIEGNSERFNRFIIAKTIKLVFEKNHSPLSNSIFSFVDACYRHNLDCYLLPAIAGVESSYGKFLIPQTYNPFGWGGGRIIFMSWEDAINEVADKIKKNYINKGLTDVYSIGKKYSQDPTWAIKILSIIENFKEVEKKQRLLLENNRVKL